jgi:hypothetical protein
MRAMGLFVLACKPTVTPVPRVRLGIFFTSRSDTSAARVQDVGFFAL